MQALVTLPLWMLLAVLLCVAVVVAVMLPAAAWIAAHQQNAPRTRTARPARLHWYTHRPRQRPATPVDSALAEHRAHRIRIARAKPKPEPKERPVLRA